MAVAKDQGGISSQTFKFLRELAQNNNRDWFSANKSRYEAARANVIDFLNGVCALLPGIDPEIPELKAEKVLMRIYRDVRFSLDKSPYKSHFAAGLSPNGKMAAEPGYFFSIAPDGMENTNYGGCFFAAGYWMPGAEDLTKIRQEIDYNFQSLHEVLENQEFKSRFPSLSEEGKLKKAPKTYAPDHPQIDLIKNKSFVVSKALTESDLSGAGALPYVAGLLQASQPFVSFLRSACKS